MAAKRQLVTEHKGKCGIGNPNHSSLSVDGCCNSKHMVSSCKPGQAASKVYSVAIENHTSHKYEYHSGDKLCWAGA